MTWRAVFTAALVFVATVASAADAAAVHFRKVQQLEAAIAHATNAVRIAMLGLDLRDEIDATLAADPNHLEARMSRVRYLAHAPSVVGGGRDTARAEAAEIAKRDPAYGHFAAGYLAYGDKEFGLARREYRAAIEGASTTSRKAEALLWMGWLSQESQQWNDAFAAFQQLLELDPARVNALYEIGRTSSFCRCDVERGRAALQKYLGSKRSEGMPSAAEARKLLAQVTRESGVQPAPQ